MCEFMRFAVIAMLLAGLAAGSSLAQQEAPAPQQTPAPSQLDEGTSEAEKSALMGLPVWSLDGKELGIVSRVLTNEAGDVEAVHASVGRPMGLGERQVRIDAGLIQVLGDRLVLTIPAEELLLLPDVNDHA